MRYAILFAGIPDERHLNGLELCYRTLVDRLRFDPRHIEALVHDGTLSVAPHPRLSPPDNGAPLRWPGDGGTAFRMRVTDEASRAGLQRAVQRLGSVMTESDSLFINVTGHGGSSGVDGRGPYLICHPYRSFYHCSQFCSDLAGLPAHRASVVILSQCFSGGFNSCLIESSRARHTFVAAAAFADRHSFVDSQDAQWDAFQRNMTGALAEHDMGTAFRIACAAGVGESGDTPTCAASSPEAERLTLSCSEHISSLL